MRELEEERSVLEGSIDRAFTSVRGESMQRRPGRALGKSALKRFGANSPACVRA